MVAGDAVPVADSGDGVGQPGAPGAPDVDTLRRIGRHGRRQVRALPVDPTLRRYRSYLGCGA